MANYTFEDYIDTELAFDPGTDTLSFAGGSANTVFFEDLGTSLRVFHDGYYVDLLNTQYEDLDSSSLVFPDGSLFLIGTTANETLTGADTNDYLDGGTGQDRMEGGNGDDDYVVNSVGDVVVEAADGGIDTVRSFLANYTLGATLENLMLMGLDNSNGYGNALDNTIYAGGGNNFMNGGGGRDTVSYQWAGNGVNVWLALSTAQDTGGAGFDTLVSFENLTGSFYNDNLRGNSLANVLQGLQGNDVLNGGAGGDTMAGGAGNDIYLVDNNNDVVIEEQSGSDGGVDLVISSIASTVLGANVENLRLTGTGNANAYGNGANNIIYAGSGDNFINGGLGTDTVSYAFATGGVQVRLNTVAQQNTAGSGMDTLLNIENLDGSAYDDILAGNSLANRISGGAGNDTLYGGAGVDTLIGGTGNDVYVVDNAGDYVIETTPLTAGGTDTVVTNVNGYTLGTNIEMLRILGDGAIAGNGNSLDNTVFTGNGDNAINGGTGYDTASYVFAEGGVTVSLATTGAQDTGASGMDTLVNFEALTGSNFDDVLRGNVGDNELNGAAGNDILIGDQGHDDLWGGDGADTFAFLNIGDSGVVEVTRDTIYDFVSGEDHIDLLSIDADTATNGDQGFTFIGGADFSATDATGQLRYDAGTGILYGSVDADSDAEFSVFLSGMPALVAEDFIL